MPQQHSVEALPANPGRLRRLGHRPVRSKRLGEVVPLRALQELRARHGIVLLPTVDRALSTPSALYADTAK